MPFGVTPSDISVCATCPFRASNHKKKHPAKWYTIANITRLWNGMRSADAPGMTCHSSDPDSVNYGSTKIVPATSEKRECAGALQLVYNEFNVLESFEKLKDYKTSRKRPLTREGIAHWAWRRMTNSLPAVVPCNDVRLPWDQDLKP